MAPKKRQPPTRKPASRKPARARAEPRTKLPEYEAKRDFTVTSEPAPGTQAPSETPTFMVHKHHASRLHYDLRLEMDGALASWAVPKGPSYDPDVKRLAVQTEDHPLEYGSFEGRIPDGEYGAGDSLIWDRGTYDTVPPGQASQMRKKGHLKFEMHGEKLRGQWHLVRTRGPSGTKSNWILFKAHDAEADKQRDVVNEAPGSVVSGRATTRGPERRQLRVSHAAPEKLLERVFPPMLATLVDAPPEPESGWLFETKYDGYRALAAVASKQVAMWTRNALDLKERFPNVARALGRLAVGEAVVDGEVVVLDAAGASRFQLLQEGSEDALFFAFDILWLDGQDLRARPIEERRDLLASVMSNVPAPLRLAERVDGPVTEALTRMEREGKEGLIVKRRGSPYVGARSRDWLKLKVQKSQEVAIVGFTPSTASDRMIGALLLGVMRDGKLAFAGKVGTGFSQQQRTELKRDLGKLQVAVSPAADAPRLRNATWVEPRMVAQVRFTEWTSDGKLRHPAFLGLRVDKGPAETQPETPAAPPREGKAQRGKRPATAHGSGGGHSGTTAHGRAASATRASGHTMGTSNRHTKTHADAGAKQASAPAIESGLVKLTNPDKVLYPKDGYAKKDVAAYYAAVTAPMLHALADRPLALQHWPDGITRGTFFRQSISDKDRAPWMRVVSTPTSTKSGSAEHLVADRPETLQWLAQRATLTVHMWSSRAASLDQPDWVIFDLDPGEGNDIRQTIPVAQALRRLFDELSLPSVPKTTGKRGLHVLVPLLPGHTHDDAIGFAVRIGQAVTSVVKEATMERTINKRGGKLYLDCYQNGYGKTIVAPYSPRALDGAPVSAPLKWSEVDEELDPGAFTIATMPARLAKLGDLFAPALSAGVRLPRFR
jgi:bifunctional non-homologous end joining protein LigD